MNVIKKLKNFFFKPDLDDHYIIEKWMKETDEADRLKELHRQSRKQNNKLNKSLTVEDFERARQQKRRKSGKR